MIIVTILVIILAIYNIIKPMKIRGPMVIKKSTVNKETWNYSQKLVSSLLLIFNFTLLVIIIIKRNSEFLPTVFERFVVILLTELIPVIITSIVLSIKYKNKNNISRIKR